MSDENDNTTLSDEEFRDQQKEQAAEQNLTGENAVPEQRPQATTMMPDSQKSAFQRAREEDPPADAEPMPQSAYDKANENKQARKAERESSFPHLLEGDTVRIIDHEDEVMNGRNGVIIGINYTPEGAVDAGTHRVVCAPEEIESIGRTELARTAP
jgi:hypothetical protein